jgi:hypothetical protein
MGRHSAAPVVPASRAGRLRQQGQSGLFGCFLYVVPVFVFISGIALAVFGVAALQGALGHGTPGYFIAQSYTCQTLRYIRECGWDGEFELPDGTVVGTDFAYGARDPAMRAGTRVAALDPSGSADTAFPRTWNWSWLADLLGALVLCVGSALWFWIAVRGARHIRASRAAATDSPADIPFPG